LSKTNLPSALCFTFLNARNHITNACFSNDVCLAGASFDDSSFRVWRNDNQPLGTPSGVMQNTPSRSSNNENKSATLRGHSAPVYGCDFTPDNRFAITSSADSTIRLWSLDSCSNMVCSTHSSSYFKIHMAQVIMSELVLRALMIIVCVFYSNIGLLSCT